MITCTPWPITTIWQLQKQWINDIVVWSTVDKSIWEDVMNFDLLALLIRIQFHTVHPFNINDCCHLDSKIVPQIVHFTFHHICVDGIEHAYTLRPKILGFGKYIMRNGCGSKSIVCDSRFRDLIQPIKRMTMKCRGLQIPHTDTQVHV